MYLAWPKKIYVLAKENFPITLTILFFVAGIIGISFHELWRDETQAWLFARDSSSLFDLIKNLRYEGHPPVWHVLLFFTVRVVDNPVAMQVLHVSIASATVYLFARFAPFRKLHKVLFAFSYLMLYEYGVLARNYSLGILFGVVFCVLYTRSKRNYVHIGITLFFMSQTSVMGAMLAVILGMIVGLDFLLQKPAPGKEWKPVLTGLAIAVFGVGLFFLQTRVPSDGAYSTLRVEDIRNTLSTIWQSYVPVPARVISYWNTNSVSNLDAATLLSLAVLFAAGMYFKRNLKFLLVYLFGTSVFLSFFYYKNLGGLRHQGYLFMFFIFCIWMMRVQEKGRVKKDGFKRYQDILLTVLLALQVVGMSVAFYKEVRLTFSRSGTAADYIREAGLDELPIIGAVDYQTSALLGFLHKDAFYAQADRQGSFVVWDTKRLHKLTDEELVAKAKSFAQQQGKDVLLVSNRELSDQGLVLRAKFLDTAVVVDELYFLYIVSP